MSLQALIYVREVRTLSARPFVDIFGSIHNLYINCATITHTPAPAHWIYNIYIDIYNRPKLVYTCLGDIEVVTPRERNGTVNVHKWAGRKRSNFTNVNMREYRRLRWHFQHFDIFKEIQHKA